MTLSPRQVADLMARHHIEPSKALGQHFVVDPNTVRRIASLAEIGPGDHVVEIGAGLGALTLALVETGAEVTALEMDRRLLPALEEVVADRARVVHADASTVDWDALLEGSERWVLVANLPYNVATPLVLDLLERAPAIERMLVMVQREAGERLAAAPGGRDYGIPSIKVAYRAHAMLVGSVPPTVFLPRPKVESVLVRIARRPEPAVHADPMTLFELVTTAFGQRRKMLRRSLGSLVGTDAFERAAVDPSARPEQLGIEDWGRLAEAVGSAG